MDKGLLAELRRAGAKRTPTHQLLLELLAARHRLGHADWPIQHQHRKGLQELADAGLVAFQGGRVENYFTAWLTDVGKEEFLRTSYVPRVDITTLPCEHRTHVCLTCGLTSLGDGSA